MIQQAHLTEKESNAHVLNILGNLIAKIAFCK